MALQEPFNRWRPHPWHGLEPGTDTPHIVQAYIEITPFDFVKYEVDKGTGYLRVDRPQRYSSQPPSLYGFIPQTYCGPRVSALSSKTKRGDGDPLDICVLSERPINRAEIILRAKVVGGFQLVDGEEADDKIIAVLANDTIWSTAEGIHDLPEALVARLAHYFSTYKTMVDQKPIVTIEETYDASHAHRVILASIDDYKEAFAPK
jgi:inorganic pyrophosphatase